MTNPPHARDRATGLCASIHDRGIKFEFSVAVKDRSAPGVEVRIVFEETDDLLDGIEARPAFGQQFFTKCQRFLQRFLLLSPGGIRKLRRVSERATVNGNRPAALWLSTEQDLRLTQGSNDNTQRKDELASKHGCLRQTHRHAGNK